MIRSCFNSSIVVAALLMGANPGAVAAEKITFMIDWLPSGDKAVPYLGVQKGLFAAEGLEVVIQSGRGSSDVVTKLGTAAADIGTGGLSALLQAKAETKVPVKAIYSIYTLQPDAIFTTEGSGITTLKDVTGKKIATATFSSSNVAWPLVLQANGIDPASVDLLKADPGALAPMLAAGRVVATINWTTVAPAFEKPLAETGKKLKVIPWSQFGYDGYGLSVFVSDKMLTERKDTVKKFLRAYAKATDLAITDPKAAAAALKTMVPEIDEAVAEAQFVASVPLMVNAIAKANGTGTFEKALLANDLGVDRQGAEHAARQARSRDRDRPLAAALASACSGEVDTGSPTRTCATQRLRSIPIPYERDMSRRDHTAQTGIGARGSNHECCPARDPVRGCRPELRQG